MHRTDPDSPPRPTPPHRTLGETALPTGPHARCRHGPKGAVADRGSVVACAGCSHPDHRRPRQSRADAAQGVQVVRTVARSTWTP